VRIVIAGGFCYNKAKTPLRKNLIFGALIACNDFCKKSFNWLLSFGQVIEKGMTIFMINCKKPMFWIVAVVVCIALAIGFLAHSATKLDSNLASYIEEQILSKHAPYKDGEFACTDFKVIGTKKSKGTIIVYMGVFYSEYDEINGEIEDGGGYTQTVITVKKTDTAQYELVEYWEPRQGSYLAKDIKDKFPWYLFLQALDPQFYIKKQQQNCYKKAQEYFASKAR